MSKVFNLIQRLHCDADTFYGLLRKKDAEKYRSFYIHKRSGGQRLIESPQDDDLIKIQIELKKLLEGVYSKHKPQCAHGYVQGNSIITNVNELLKNNSGKYILKIDIKDFFGSITYERIFGLLKREMHITDESANAICLLVTCNRHLPQGASTSPVIANMICKRMDKKLLQLAKSIGAIYTRYADDLFFSFSSAIDAKKLFEGDSLKSPLTLSLTLKNIIWDNGFAINNRKVKLLSKANSQNVCGIVVNEFKNVRRDFLRDLRVKIYKYGKGEITNKSSIVGKLSFARLVRGLNDRLVCKYCSKFNKMTTPPFPDADFRLNEMAAMKHYTVRIDLENGDWGTGFFLRGFLITSLHVIEKKGLGEAIDRNKTMPGYFKSFKINYYDNAGKKKSVEIKVGDAFIFNEIAFLKISNYELFKNKELKVQSEQYDYENNDAFVIGSQSSNSRTLGLVSKNTSIIETSYLHNSDAYLVRRGTIYHGMSGGPLIDSKTYRVIGVSLSGQLNEEHEQENACSILYSSSFKQMKKWEPDPIWLIHNKGW